MKRTHIIDAKSLAPLRRSTSTDHLRASDSATGSVAPLLAWQPGASTAPYLAACAHASSALRIHSRHGDTVDVINLQAACTALAWSPDGVWLAVAQAGASAVVLWHAERREDKVVECGSAGRGVVSLAWSTSGDLLTAGTTKGTMILIPIPSMRPTPVLGKHDRAITHIAACTTSASNNNNAPAVVTLSDDKTLSISNTDGDTLAGVPLGSIPKHLRVFSMLLEAGGKPHVIACTTLEAGAKLYMHSITSPKTTAPILLIVQSKYGPVIAIAPYIPTVKSRRSSGANASSSPRSSTTQLSGGTASIATRLAIVTKQGYVILISLEPESLGQEVAGARVFRNDVTGVGIVTDGVSGDGTGLVIAVASEGTVKVVDVAAAPDLRDMPLTVVIDDVGDGSNEPVDRIVWSGDKRVMTVSRGGAVLSYTSAVAVLAVSNGRVTATVSGSAELTIGDKKLVLPGEPQQLAMSNTHLAACIGQSTSIYTLADLKLVRTHTQPHPVTSVDLHPGYCYITTAKELSVVPTTPTTAEPPNDCLVLPRPACLTAAHAQFLMTATGSTVSVWIPPAKKCIDYSIGQPIAALLASPTAPLVLADTGSSEGGAFIVNPAQSTAASLPPAVGNRWLWDSVIPNLVYAWSDESGRDGTGADERSGSSGAAAMLTTIAYTPHTLAGVPMCVTVCSVPVPTGWTPLHVARGHVMCAGPNGRNVGFAAGDGSLLAMYYAGDMPRVMQGVAKLCPAADTAGGGMTGTMSEMNRRVLAQLVDAMLSTLDLASAARVLATAGDHPAAIYLLSSAEDTDAAVLRGHVLAHMGDIAGAQEMYLASRSPVRALDLRRDLGHWEQALALAGKIAPDDEPALSCAYAAALEADGRFADALVMYQRGADGARPASALFRTCTIGAAKMRLRVGDVKATRVIIEMNDPGVSAEAAGVLEEMREWAEAGGLYARAGRWEKSASCLLKGKLLSKLPSIMTRVTAPALLSEYGLQLEAAGQTQEALEAYMHAQDAAPAARLLLAQSRIDEAVALVRSTRSREAAKRVADFFAGMGDARAVVEFYLLADMRAEAQHRAREAGILHVYLQVLGDEATQEEHLAAAVHYEQARDALQAGKCYMNAGHYEAAVAHLLRAAAATSTAATGPAGGESGPAADANARKQAVDLAIECVGKAKNDVLTHEVVGFLMSGGLAVRDPRTIFRLYMSLGQVREAARTALVIARDDWAGGNYRPARDVLWETAVELRKLDAHIPAQMLHMLALLHSYILVKVVIRMDDHVAGARMLVRVSKNISWFPSHVIQILTSTVLECMRVGFKASAAEFAAILMRPENRQKVDEKYKKKIESLVRKQQADDCDPAEEQSPCPHCTTPVNVTELDCSTCKNSLPFCVASGNHMTASEWSQCPKCTAPGLLPAMLKVAASKAPECPMCGVVWAAEELVLEPNVPAAVARWTGDKRAPVADEGQRTLA
ncbi:hypothetical protein BC828DRAFT_386629 [Blastocladiella britannica]|nr:hypothetical protein BC828DRAFT_386629 [Blastocladiella britannica]